MKVGDINYRTVRMDKINPYPVYMIDQNLLPFEFKIHKCDTYLDTCKAISDMTVRGAGAIGAAAGFAMAQGVYASTKENLQKDLEKVREKIESTRPTAGNLFYAVDRVFDAALKSGVSDMGAFREAHKIADEDVENCKKIGEFGNSLIKDGMGIETHCNAGWLAFVDFGTALSPIYEAHKEGKNLIVYVDETRPRGQGARLTAWELKNEGVPHFIIPDNAGCYLMSQKKVNLIITGADRIARNGDAANKIGTLEKAIIAKEYGIPFYIAAPTSTFDLECETGEYIKIEERNEDEVLYQTGLTNDGKLEKILVCSPLSKALNPAFDVTLAKYITGIITEKGIIKPSEEEIKKLFS